VATADTSPGVLVVDDDEAIRMVCRVNLELDGFRVLEAATVADARHVLETEPVDVVLLDLNLGAERSDALVDELRGRTPPVPVALVTGSSDAPRADRPEADAVLTKPFDLEELTATVRRLTALAHAER
jgi:DNA-binding NtrC family response regulator